MPLLSITSWHSTRVSHFEAYRRRDVDIAPNTRPVRRATPVSSAPAIVAIDSARLAPGNNQLMDGNNRRAARATSQCPRRDGFVTTVASRLLS